jgi:hypothetical protein
LTYSFLHKIGATKPVLQQKIVEKILLIAAFHEQTGVTDGGIRFEIYLTNVHHEIDE